MKQRCENSFSDITADNFEDAGIMTAPLDESFRIDIRSLDAYFKNNNVDPADMTDEEVTMFVKEPGR